MGRWIHKESNIKEEEDVITIYPEATTKIYYKMDGNPIRFVVVVIPVDVENKKFGIFVRLFPYSYYPIRLTIGHNFYTGITIKELNFKDTYKFDPITITREKKIILGYFGYEHFATLQKVQNRHPDRVSEEIKGGNEVDGISLSKKNQG